MKVIICAINSKFVHSSLAPWFLMAGIKKFCKSEIMPSVLEFTINQSDNFIIEKIYLEKPDVVAFSCYIWNISLVKRIISSIHEILPLAKIVLGGPEVTFNSEDLLMEFPQIDYIIKGEGEKSFALLLDSINYKSDFSNIDKLCYKSQDGEVYSNATSLSDEEPLSPYTTDYFNSLNGRIAYIETSRGCPFSCSFCLSGVGEPSRFFGLERAKKELLLLANSGTQTIKLVDRTFNCNPKYSYEIFEFLIEKSKTDIKNDVCFHFEVAADLFDSQTIDLLKTAPIGLFQFEVGLQSFNLQTIEAVNRKTNLKKLTENLNLLLKQKNIHIHIDLIAGLPFETLESFKNSFNLALALSPDVLQLGFLKILHGAQISNDIKKYDYRYSPYPPYEIFSNKWLSYTQIISLRKVEDALEKLYNSGRFYLTLKYLLETTNLSPFDLFSNFGTFAYEKSGISGVSLDSYTGLVFEYFSRQKGVIKAVLRDYLAFDRLSIDNTGKLPPCLKIADIRLKEAVKNIVKPKFYKKINNAEGLDEASSLGKLGIAILYSPVDGEQLAVVDYRKKDKVIGRYKSYKIPLINVLTKNIESRAKK